MPKDRLVRWMIVAAPSSDGGTARDIVCVQIRTEPVARAIAAAPDLLQVAYDLRDVLQETVGFCECGEPDCRTTRLRAAIKKATGE